MTGSRRPCVFVSACICVHVHSVCVCVKQVHVCQGIHVEVRDQPLTLFDIGCFCCYFAVVSSCLAHKPPGILLSPQSSCRSTGITGTCVFTWDPEVELRPHICVYPRSHRPRPACFGSLKVNCSFNTTIFLASELWEKII